MACCVTLGFQSVDTRSNAAETARWIADNKFRSVRLVTTDWHMRRAAGELSAALPGDVELIRDAVPSQVGGTRAGALVQPSLTASNSLPEPAG